MNRIETIRLWINKKVAVRPESMGLNIWIILLAFFLSLVFYACINLGLYCWTWFVSNQPLASVRPGNSPMERAEDYIELTGGDKNLIPWIGKNIRPVQTYPEQIVGLIHSVQSSASNVEKETKQKAKKLNALLNGNPQGLFWVRPDKFSSASILRQITDANWNKELEKDPLADSKKAFLEQFIGEVSKAREVPLRLILRVNGSIQNILVFVFMLTAILLFRRYTMLEVMENRIQNREISTEVLPRLNQTEECIYRPLSSIISVLPSLGFIGTVLGMGAALMKADNLFSAQDKQQAMGYLTQELGFAFDTTFVALVLALILEMGFMWVRSKEARILNEFSLDTNMEEPS